MKKLIPLIILLLLFLVASIYMRSSNFSEGLKAIILPEIEKTLNQQVTVDKIYLNIFPLFIGFNELKVIDKEGKETFYTKKIRGYVGFFELFNNKIMIKRLSLKKPITSMEKKELEDIISSISKLNSADSKKTITLSIKSIHIDNADISLRDEAHSLSMSGVNAYIVTIGKPEIKISGDRFAFSKKDLFNLDGRIALHFILENNFLEIKSFNLAIKNNSDFKTTGFFNINRFSGELSTELNLFVDSLKRMFGLTNRGEGFLSVRGSIKTADLKSDIKNIFLNLRVKGDIYLETLMELLKVKEKLEGKISFNGTLKGKLDEMVGNATAELQRGNLFGVQVDKLTCMVDYAEGKMRFTNGIAAIYNGKATAEAVINLPVVNHFSLNVKAHEVSSKKIFELIKWDPGISEGKVSGEISSSGRVFNPDIQFIYKNIDIGKDILGRIDEIKGTLSMRDNLINFSNLTFLNDKSILNTEGTADLKSSRLSFTGKGKTLDLKNITSPYFTAISGSGDFNILLSGDFANPIIDLKFISNNLSLATVNLGANDVFNNRVFKYNSSKATLTYEKNLLLLKDFYAKQADEEFFAKGKISFKKANKLFEIKEPEYDLELKGKNFDIGVISKTIKGLPEMNGSLSADFNMKGQPNSLSFIGEFKSKNFSYKDNYIADKLDGNFTYAKRQFFISPAYLKRGDSLLSFNGTISLDKKYFLNAKGNKIRINDIAPEYLKEQQKIGALMDMRLNNLTIYGEGSLDNPSLEIKGLLHGTENRVGWLNKNNIYLKIAEKKANLNLSLMEGRLSLSAFAKLDGMTPWTMDIILKSANYAPLLTGFVKDTPDDLLLNLTGTIKAYGDKDNIYADIILNRLFFNSYGVALSNKSDIIMNIKNKSLHISNFDLKGDDAEFSLGGTLKYGQNLDLTLEGTSSIAPLKALSKEIDTLRGKAYFILSLSGDWNKPEISGGFDLINGTLALKAIPNRLTSVSAYLYVDEDKIILKNLDGKFAGGDISASGTAYLKGLSINNFFVETKLKSLTISYSKNIWADFDGILYYRGSMKSQELSGDINIKRSKYSQRVEWKSWLLSARKAELAKPDISRLGQTILNVRLKGENLLIENNIAETVAKMDMTVRGTIGKPILLGKINTDKGMVYFRNNEFKILKARVDFVDPEKTTPFFDILAETKVKNYLIKLNLDGNFDHFALSLTSDPHLNESDIFSLLTVGHIGKQMKGLEGGVGTTEATSFLVGKLQDVFEERVKTLIGIDRIQIDPQVSRTTGTVNPRITVAKKILGDKLHITYSASTGVGEEQIWKLEYFLDKNISFVGVRDERGGIGGDVKFRFEFK